MVIEKILRQFRDERIVYSQENYELLLASINSILEYLESIKLRPKSFYDDVASLKSIFLRINNPVIKVTSKEYSKLLSESQSKLKKIAKNKLNLLNKEDYPLTYQELKELIDLYR